MSMAKSSKVVHGSLKELNKVSKLENEIKNANGQIFVQKMPKPCNLVFKTK
jgi:hypothetical protein